MMNDSKNHLGIDWLQWKTIFLTSIKIELRENQRIGGKHKGKLSPLISGLIFYAGMGLILAANLVTKTDPFMYSMFILTYGMVMSGFSIILEFGNSILNPDDWEILSYRPLNSKTYFLAKLANLLFYIILITSALCLLPALIGIGIEGNQLWFPLTFLPIAYLANIATASLVVLIYTLLLQKINYQKFKDIIAYLQIGFSLALFLFYQIIPRLRSDILLKEEKNLQTWLYLTPPAWFAGIINLFHTQVTSIDVHLGLIGICCTGIIILFAFKKISLQYAGLIANINATTASETPGKTKKLFSRGENVFLKLIRSFIKNQEVAAGFDFTIAMCKKDRSVKMGIYPLLAIPLAFLGLAIFEKALQDPLIHGLFLGQGITLFLIFIFLMMYSLTMLMKYSNDWEASWIFHLAPLESPGKFYQGVKGALFFRYVFPFFILLGIIYAIFIPLLHTLHFLISLFVFSLLFTALISFQINTYPFSEKRQKGERMRRFTFIIFVGPMFGLYTLLYNYIFKHFAYWLIGQIGILTLWKLFESLSVKKIDKNLKIINPNRKAFP